MKKFISIISMLIVSISLFAGQKVVYIEYFKMGNGVDEARAEQVRGTIIAALMQYEHLKIVDVASQASLAIEKGRRSDEDAIEDETARIGKMKKLGANYLVQGWVTTLSVAEKIDYDRKGRAEKAYKASMSCSIKVIDCEDGTLLSTDVLNFEGRDEETPEESLNYIFKKLPASVDAIAEKDFKLRTIIFDSEYVAKNGKLQKCYINLGSDDGVMPGTVFSVKQATVKLGRVAWVEIGELVIESIVASDVALCYVRSGSDAIFKALEEYISIKETDPANAHELVVESKSFVKKK